MKILLLILSINFIFISNVFAWGKRGHQITGEVAALLVSSEPNAEFMKEQSLDFGLYSNIPDFVWKRPETYDKERNQHFVDLEEYSLVLKNQKAGEANIFSLERKDFETKYPLVKEEAGRVFWRARELESELGKITEQLRALKEDSERKPRQALQEKWLVIAGTMGHYWGDLSQPLHVTHNYDGQLTEQKGLHSYFEEAMVTELYPELLVKVLTKAKSDWSSFKTKNSKKSILELLEQLSQSSQKEIKTLLALDKGHKREVKLTEAKRYEKLIINRLSEGALTYAEVLRRHLGWKFDSHKFYFFSGEPAYIVPGGSTLKNN